MKSRQVDFLVSLFVILLFSVFAYYYRADIFHVSRILLNKVQPCQRPITYSIANLDPRFGLSKEELLLDIAAAEKIWEEPSNKQLFAYADNGDLKINLLYDSRQEATDALKKIGLVIHSDRTSYDTLKAKYDSLNTAYQKQRTQLEDLLATYNKDKSAYEQDVNYWNSRGGAPKAQYNDLEQRRIDLNNQVAIINKDQDALNTLADTINSLAINLNKLISTLNLKIDSYNTIGQSNGKQFNEGEYLSSADTATINIYQFNDQAELIGVLAHELGHALGLEHVDDTKAIMYYLNEGGSINMTAEDTTELNRVCRIK